MNYPKHRMGKDIIIKLAPQVGVMNCKYRHLVKSFGNPTFSIDNGDEFDGIEKIAWHIEFESGEVARISDVRPFGRNELDYRDVDEWRVNAHSDKVYVWIKEKIRDANPNQ